MKGWTDEWSRLVNRWLGVWMDRRTDDALIMDRWTDGSMDRYIHYIYI